MISRYTSMQNNKTILVIGGAGYIGSALVPKLLRQGYAVRVLDLYFFGRDVFLPWRGPMLEEVVGDMRDREALAQVMRGADVIINLACISNDPSFELNPEFSKAINYDAIHGIIREAIRADAGRLIHASTASVYGVQDKDDATEDMPFEKFVPVSDYNKYKALAEELIKKDLMPHIPTIIIRPSTVCGWSPRLRLDLTVNIFVHQAVRYGHLTTFGGKQMRPNIHIDDITDLYVCLAAEPESRIAGKIYNAGNENLSIQDIAERVRSIVGPMMNKEITIHVQPSNDPRSYRVSSEKIKKELGFIPQKKIDDAARELVEAFLGGRIPDPDDARYYNVKTMKLIKIK